MATTSTPYAVSEEQLKEVTERIERVIDGAVYVGVIAPLSKRNIWVKPKEGET